MRDILGSGGLLESILGDLFRQGMPRSTSGLKYVVVCPGLGPQFGIVFLGDFLTGGGSVHI